MTAANRFRFRAWDASAKYMLPVFELKAANISYSVSASDIIVMQSIGLLDRNGKEIFEGDILSPPNCTTHKQWIDVAWDNEQACFNLHRRLRYSAIKDCEIIGNSYENPLLPMERYC